MDIRDKQRLEHEDIIGLNFISDNAPYIFEFHYEQGLRSHIIRLLDPQDCRARDKGIEKDGIKTYPRPTPNYILRIYKSSIDPEEAIGEIKKLNEIKKYMMESVAHSDEFVVSYKKEEHYEPIFCGFQEYIEGEVVDPWFCIPKTYGESFPKKTNKFINRVKDTIKNTGYIPDLAGIGNIIYNKDRGLVLTDINNINVVDYSDEIFLDNKGFPIIDTSVEALYNLETVVNGSAQPEKLYEHYLEENRKTKCMSIRKKWAKKDELPFLAAH